MGILILIIYALIFAAVLSIPLALFVLIKYSITIFKRKKTSKAVSYIIIALILIGFDALFILSIIDNGCGRCRARDSHRVSDVRQVELALELYYAAHLQYPNATGIDSIAALATEGFLNMSAFPTDPTTSNPYCYAVGTDLRLGAGRQKAYYHIGTKLESKDSDMLTQDIDDNTQNSDSIIWSWNQSPDCGTNPANSNFDGTDSKESTIYDRGIFPK